MDDDGLRGVVLVGEGGGEVGGGPGCKGCSAVPKGGAVEQGLATQQVAVCDALPDPVPRDGNEAGCAATDPTLRCGCHAHDLAVGGTQAGETLIMTPAGRGGRGQ